MRIILLALFILPSIICLGQTNSYQVGSNTSDFKEVYKVPSDKLWSITTVEDGCRVTTQA